MKEITGLSKEFFQGAEAQTLKDSLGTIITSEEELLAVLGAMKEENIEDAVNNGGQGVAGISLLSD